MKSIALLLIAMSVPALAADKIIGDQKSGGRQLVDNNGNRWNLGVAYTTDGNGDIYTLGGLSASNDRVIGDMLSGSHMLIDNSSNRWNLMVWYTTDGAGNVIPIPSSGGGGGGTGNVNNGGNTYGSNMSVGTNDNYTLSLLADGVAGMTLEPNPTFTSYPYASFGTLPQVAPAQTNQYEFYTRSNGSGNDVNFTGLYTETDLQSTTDGSGYQQGVYAVVHSDANTGTYTLMRNYHMCEADGNATITECYGDRALTRIFDTNYPTQTSTGTITNGYGLEVYAHSTSPTATMKNATGILVSHANAGNSAGTGSDSAVHTAYGIHIQADVAATGSSNQNIAYSILSDATVPSVLNGQLNLWSNAGLEFSDTNYHYININAPSSFGQTYSLILPPTIGTSLQCLGNSATAGTLAFQNCVASIGSGTSLVYSGDQIKTLVGGTNITLSDNGSGNITINSASGASTQVNYGGDSKGSDETIGLNDSHNLSFVTNGTNRIYLTNTAGVFINQNSASNFTVPPYIFGVYDYHTANDSTTETVFDHSFAYYGNSSNSKTATDFNFAIRPGLVSYSYTGQYTDLLAQAYVSQPGFVSQLEAASNSVSTQNATATLNFAIGTESQVVAPSGIIRNAAAVQIPDSDAVGSDTSSHTAYGVDIGSNGGIVATGGTTNTAAALHIGATVTADAGLAWAVKSDSTAPASFAGGVSINTSSTQPTCSVTYRGMIWVVRGSSGVADSHQICEQTASGYYWVDPSPSAEPALTVTASFTAIKGQRDFFCNAASAAVVVTLPKVSTLGDSPQSRQVYCLKKTDSSGNACSFAANATDLIDGSTTNAISSQYTNRCIVDDGGTNWYVH